MLNSDKTRSTLFGVIAAYFLYLCYGLFRDRHDTNTTMTPMIRWLFLILFAVFMLMFLLTRRISACSITCAAVYPIIYWLLNPGFTLAHVLCLVICVLVIFLHRSNIRRLLRGEEAEFKPKMK